MSKITLNFFGEIITVEKPKSLSALRKDISRLFCFSAQDAAEIILTYNDNGDKAIIANDDDLKAFFNSKATMIDLDISQNSQIYKDNLNQLQEESLKDKKCLEELLKKKEEFKKLRQTKFEAERKEMKEIQAKINELSRKKIEIRKKILEGVRELEKQKKENDKKIMELQKKLGLPLENEKKKPEIKMNFRMMPMHHLHHPMFRFKPPCHKKNLNKKPLEVKFGNTEYINIPKEENNDYDLKMKTIDDWGKCLLSKTQEITNRLAETFKGFPVLNFSLDFEDDKKEEKKVEKKEEKKEEPKNEIKEEKVTHQFYICDGCGMNPIVGKRYNCKKCSNFDFCEKCYDKNKKTHGHEFTVIEKPMFGNLFFPNIQPHHHHHKKNPLFRHKSKKHMPELKLKGMKPEGVPKKMEHCPTMGNIFEKPKDISNKIIHFGVKCDGCGKFPIVGCRYKCAVCDDFDYCEDCEKKLSEKHNHPFLKIYEPKMKPAFFQIFNKQ